MKIHKIIKGFVLVLISLAGASALAAKRPVVVGNGGDAVLCEGASDNPDKGEFNGLYSLDYLLSFPGRNDELVSWSSLDEGWRELESLVIRIMPEHRRSFQDFRHWYRNEVNLRAPRLWEAAPFGLVPLEDEGMVSQLPNDCRKHGQSQIVQAVVRQDPEFSGTSKLIYKFVPAVLDDLEANDPRQLTFLLIHEWLWDLSPNVDQNRRLNRFLHDKATYSMDTAEAREVVEGLGFRLSRDPLNRAAMLSVGSRHGCMIDQKGVQCWGTNAEVPALDHPTAVAVGDHFSCAMDQNGVQCWGAKSLTVPSLKNPFALAAASTYACALDDTGAVCWGQGNDGLTTPPKLTNPRAITTGPLHACALDDEGLKCWGRRMAIPVNTLQNPVAVSIGGQNTCVIDDNGMQCWGPGTITDVPALHYPTMVSIGHGHACALDGGSIECWGHTDVSIIPAMNNPDAVAAGDRITCARHEAGLSCWGESPFADVPPPQPRIN